MKSSFIQIIIASLLLIFSDNLRSQEKDLLAKIKKKQQSKEEQSD